MIQDKMKKHTLLSILFCLIISFAVLSMAIITAAAHPPEGVARTQAENAKYAEYERLHPKPQNSPPALDFSWTETSINSAALTITTRHADNTVVVYVDKDMDIYHMEYCRFYQEKASGDYSNPHWLCEVVLNGVRCTECISDEMYDTYKEAVYRTE